MFRRHPRSQTPVPRRAKAIAAASALTLPVLALAAPASAQDGSITDVGTGDAEVVPISPVVAAVDAGDSQWIAIQWTALHAEARELKVTATGSDGVAVSYPTYPVDGYSSGYWDDTLSVSEIDYTALNVTVDSDAVGPHSLDVTVSYVSDTGPHSETFTMPFDDGVVAPPTTEPEPTPAPEPVELAACDDVVIDSFLALPYTFTFQVRNASSTVQRFEFVVPDVNYDLGALVFNGSADDVTLVEADGSVIVAGTLPAYASVGGIVPNGWFGTFWPTNGEPYVLCGSA